MSFTDLFSTLNSLARGSRSGSKFPGNHRLLFWLVLLDFKQTLASCLKSLCPYFSSMLRLNASCRWVRTILFSPFYRMYPLAVQFDRHLCSKVLTAFQIRPALLARIYSDTKMNLSRVLWLHDLSYNIYPAAVLLSHFSSPLKLMLTFYYWICSCPQIKT